MKKFAMIAVMGLAFAAQADIMLYWSVDVDSDATTGTQTKYSEGTLDYAVNAFYANHAGDSTYPTQLYATIEATKKGTDVYTVLDTISVGSKVDKNITGWDSTYDNYIVRLYNSTDLVAYSDTYTYQSLIANDSTYMTDTMGMKATSAQMMNNLSGKYHAAPEPTSALLMLLGLAGLALKRKNV